MNKIFVIGSLILLFLLGTLFYFYYRDVIGQKDITDNSCLPKNLELDDITSSSAKISWNTTNECVGFVKYGENIDYMSMISLDEKGSLRSASHSVDLSDLKPGTTYYIYVFSDDKDYGYDGNPLLLRTLSY